MTDVPLAMGYEVVMLRPGVVPLAAAAVQAGLDDLGATGIHG